MREVARDPARSQGTHGQSLWYICWDWSGSIAVASNQQRRGIASRQSFVWFPLGGTCSRGSEQARWRSLVHRVEMQRRHWQGGEPEMGSQRVWTVFVEDFARTTMSCSSTGWILNDHRIVYGTFAQNGTALARSGAPEQGRQHWKPERRVSAVRLKQKMSVLQYKSIISHFGLWRCP